MVKKLTSKIVTDIIAYNRARHKQTKFTSNEVMKLYKKLKKQLGSSFTSTLLKFGNPDEDFQEVQMNWANLLLKL